MAVQDLVQLTVAEHNASAHETVRAVAGDLLKAREDIRCEWCGSELSNQFVIVHRQKLAGLIDATGDIERRDDLTDGLYRGGFFGEAQCGERRWLTWFVHHDMQFAKTEVKWSVSGPQTWQGYGILLRAVGCLTKFGEILLPLAKGRSPDESAPL